uniref:Putative secreted protein n=1 Tax=Ixodes ricinus TaxID=34613 RepID=A0A147BDT4_IXORI
MYKTSFLMLPVLYSALLFFLKHLGYCEGMSICSSTNSVSHDRFFALNHNSTHIQRYHIYRCIAYNDQFLEILDWKWSVSSLNTTIIGYND